VPRSKFYVEASNVHGNVAYQEVTYQVCGGETVIPENEILVFNYTYGTLNEEGIPKQAILDFKSFLISNIAECPTLFWQLNSTKTHILYAESDIMLDETLNQINVSM
jgi:hypothetical protein